jgi:hypothetical protein
MPTSSYVEPPAGWSGWRSVFSSYWAAQEVAGVLWLRQQPDAFPGLSVLVRLERTTDGGAACTGLLFERAGEPVSVRDLRAPVGQILAQVDKVAPWVGGDLGRPLVRPARPGRRGYSQEHWQRVSELYEEARRRSPRSPIKWMRDRWDQPVSDATMRRWVKAARAHNRGREQLEREYAEQQRLLNRMEPLDDEGLAFGAPKSRPRPSGEGEPEEITTKGSRP